MKSNWLAYARLLLGGILLLAAGTLALRARHGVETDLYALADTAHGGVLRELATGMAGQGRVLLEGNDFEVLKAEAESIRARFRQPTGDFKDTLKFIGAHRAGLLSPETREQLTAGRYKDVADAALARLYGFLPPLVSVKEDPFLLAVEAFTADDMSEATKVMIEEDPAYARPATEAEKFDNLLCSKFYKLLQYGMMVRANECALAAMEKAGEENEPKRAALTAAFERAEAAHRKLAEELESEMHYEVVPIRKLVEIQLGCGLLALEYVKKINEQK